MKIFIRNNALSICFFGLFVITLLAQIFFGLKEYNKELIDQGVKSVTVFSYLSTGHFFQSTFENWESEFLQMALLVLFTIFLQQKGSSESKDFDKKEQVDREPSAKRRNVPWPVKKGGLILAIYKHSLSIALLLLFLFSFIIHFYGSWKDENEHLALKGKVVQTCYEYIWSSRFWFESFQNWQSEFLSVFTIIVLSIYLRQIGSSQSKPVDTPNMKTGN